MKKILIYISILVLILGGLIVALIFSNRTNLDSVYNSVVYIESIDEETIRSGSGFVYKVQDNKNYIVTSYHVIEGYNDIYIYNNNKEKARANILNYDEYTDIAILTIEDSLNLKEISIDNSNKVNVDDKIYVVGTPLNIEKINTISEGKVTFTNKEVTIYTSHGSSNLETIQVTAKVDYGNSGGPLLDKSGKVIGMMFVKEESVSSKAYALPSNFVIDIVDKLITNELQRPNLGAVMCNTTNADLLNEYGLSISDISGVVILEVKDLGILYNVGLQKGDIITKLNNKEINNVNELREELYKKSVGDNVVIEYYRDETYHKTIVKL